MHELNTKMQPNFCFIIPQQCSVWWYNLSEQERERFQEMADRSNATQALNATSYTTQVNQVQQVRIYIYYRRTIKIYHNIYINIYIYTNILLSFNSWHT